MNSKLSWIALSMAMGAAAFAAPSPAETPGQSNETLPPISTPSDSSFERKRTIEQDGQLFYLAASRSEGEVATEDYVLTGETLDRWSQLVTYQRIRLDKPIGADEFVENLKRRLQRTSVEAHLFISHRHGKATLFGLRYPESSGASAQITLACAFFPDGNHPNELHLLQYSAAFRGTPDALIERQGKLWQVRLQKQAALVER